MDELMDLLVKDGSSSQISDQIKSILFQKSAEKVDAIRPQIASSMFNDDVNLDEIPQPEFDSEVELSYENWSSVQIILNNK